MGKKDDNYFKRLADQRLTQDEKIGTTVGLCLLIPTLVIIQVYVSSSVTCMILSAAPNMAHKNLFMEYDDNKLPYRRKPKHSVSGNTGTVFDNVDITKKEKSSLPAQTGGKRKKYRQKGGNIPMPAFNKATNATKAFLDSTKHGMPYEWAENENFIINSFGEYFITIWTTYRKVYSKALEIVHETFYKNHPTEPNNMGDYLMDWAKIAIIAPIFHTLVYAANFFVGVGALIWGAINNQGIFGMVFWGSIAVCTIFWACLFYAVGGYNWFWPWNIMGIYYTVQLFKQNFWDKWKLFQTYAERWKFWWVFVMLTGLFATVNWTWATRVSKKKVNWDKQILIGTGVGFGLLFLSMLGIVSVI